MGLRLITAVSAAALLAAAPAMAQMNSMSSDKMSGSSMKMSKSGMKMMNKCKAMSHDMMMKNKGCMKMMKMHPDMMPGG